MRMTSPLLSQAQMERDSNFLTAFHAGLLQSSIPKERSERAQGPTPEQLVARGAAEHLVDPALPWA